MLGEPAHNSRQRTNCRILPAQPGDNLGRLRERGSRFARSLETIDLPVPEPVARILRQAIERDSRQRWVSLDTLVSAIEQLPTHCVASNQQLQSCIRQMAPHMLSEGLSSAVCLAGSDGDSTAPPSRATTLHFAGPHNWDPPTFAERRLVGTGFATVEAVKSASEPLGSAFAMSVPASRRRPRRRLLGLILGLFVTLAAIGSAGLLLRQKLVASAAKATVEPDTRQLAKKCSKPRMSSMKAVGSVRLPRLSEPRMNLWPVPILD